jgi:hypothetical protein
MNEAQEWLGITIFHSEALVRDLLLSRGESRWVRPGCIPQPPVVASTRHKLLKTDRLLVFQFDVKMPSFWQATDCPKRETLWVIQSTVPG